MTAFPTKIQKRWCGDSDDRYAHRFAHFNVVAHRIADECIGDWHFPDEFFRADLRLIMNSFTGNRLHDEWIDGDSLFRDRLIEKVTPVTLLLPIKEEEQSSLLSDIWRGQLADIAHYLSSVRPVNGTKATEIVLDSGGRREYRYRPRDSMLNSITSLLRTPSKMNSVYSLQNYIEQRLPLSYRDWVAPYQYQISDAVIALSAWQVVRTLLFIEAITEEVLARLEQSPVLDDALHNAFGLFPFGLHLRHVRIDEHRVHFFLNLGAWIAPFRTRCTYNGVELTVFLISPPDFGSETPPLKYWCPPINSTYFPI